jgi:hypothetical protein
VDADHLKAGRLEAEQLIPGFQPETALERSLASDRALLEGLAWGEPRAGHPEGGVGTHVAHLLDALDDVRETAERRGLVRFIALIHDSFKSRVRRGLPRVGENHHAMRARRFAEKYTDDERVLAAIELHDRPYALWRKMQRKGRLDERAFTRMMKRIPDPALFLRFIELDGSTDGKRPEPVEWFRGELVERGYVDRETASALKLVG